MTENPLNLDAGSLQQSRTMLREKNSRPDAGELYRYSWPPVGTFTGFEPEIADFVLGTPEHQDELLTRARRSPDEHGRLLHELLSEVYAYLFSYQDGACTAEPDDALETRLLTAKIRLERELLDHWLTAAPLPDVVSQAQVGDYLEELAESNAGVRHPLFDYLRDDADPVAMARFLQCEVIRNEVVDDEVALLVVGLQGMQKAVAAANLWDECGRGRLENFHTYWLRRLLSATPGGWDELAAFRGQHPWFAKITSNTNGALLHRPAHKFMAYGCFLVFESWVEPHFRRVLDGLDRLGVVDQDLRIYFAAHVAVDPRHAQELADGLRQQQPELTPVQLRQVLFGAHLAAEAGVRQFDRMLDYLKNA